ncbi:hypothetical protein F4777DRAFT_583354 [Nemania sp. FL0916]|nr:hypothetical protein F4777DRAFT_583354 [Nemania sp. FL0916]
MDDSSPRFGASAGGFLPPRNSLPSPTPSTASSRVAALLPHPRSRPLVPGSRKEDYARDYVARRLLHISRRYVKKFGIPDPADEITGYEGMDQVCRDLDEVVDVLWFSGTPSLQVPYLLNAALAFNTYLPSFPPAPRPTFSLLKKMDHCFASLLVGYDVKTKEPLPGFSAVDNSAKLRFSRTDMVRCKSLADETRMLVAVVMSGEVDVVHEMEDEDAPKTPARDRIEAPSTSAVVPNSASHGARPAKPVKTEEVGDSVGLSLIAAKPTSPTKRKVRDMVDGIAITDAVVTSKRVKVGSSESPQADSSDPTPSHPSLEPSADSDPKNDEQAQFRWALEEDDNSDDDQPNGSVLTTGDAALGGHPPSRSRSLSSGDTEQANRRVENEDNRDGGDDESREYEDEEAEDEDEDEDEDEELQMNVGQVYEKTIVQLGQSLGQTIIGD